MTSMLACSLETFFIYSTYGDGQDQGSFLAGEVFPGRKVGICSRRCEVPVGRG